MGREKDVRRLEVAVHHAAPVERLECAEDAEGDLEGILERDLLAGDAVRERLAGEQLHDEIELAVGFGELVDVADVGMTDAGGGAGLANQPLAERAVVRNLADALDGDGPVEPVVVRGVHHPHAALAEPAGDPVAADRDRLGVRAHRLPAPAEHHTS